MAQNPQEKEDFVEALLTLFKREERLLSMISLTDEKLKTIEKCFENKLNVSFATSLPFGLTQLIDSVNYPYYRTIAKLRYAHAKNSTDTQNMMDPYLLDNEICLLYRTLISRSQKTNLNSGHRRAYREFAYLSLMNSPSIEENVIQNGMNPSEYVDDCIEFHTSLICWNYMQKLKNSKTYLDDKTLQEYTDVRNLLDNKRSLNFYRIPRFNKRFQEIIQVLCQFGSTEDNIRSPYFEAMVIYLKCITAFLDRKSREEAYTSILSYEKIRLSKYPWLKNFIKENAEDIEKNMVSQIRKVSLNPTYKIS